MGIQLGVSLDTDLYELVKRESERRRSSKSDVIRNAIVKYFNLDADLPAQPAQRVESPAPEAQK